MDIPNSTDIKYYFEIKLFNHKFTTSLKKSIDNNKKIFTIDFKDFKYKDKIFKELKDRGYTIQYCQYGEMYAITWI